MSKMRKSLFVATLFALVLFLAPAATTQAGDRGGDAAAAAAAADDFKDCCKEMKENLDTCDDLFAGDPAALALCRDEAFGQFRECVAEIDFSFGVKVFGDAAQAVQACPASLPMPL